MFKLKPRCKQCGRRLKDNVCVNPKCIDYVKPAKGEKSKEKEPGE